MNPRLLPFLTLLGASLVSAAEPAAPVARAIAPPPAARVAVAAAPAPVRVPSSVAPTAPYENFRAIVDRNIFNPNRTGRRVRGGDDAPAPRLDTITLVGTMNSDRGLMSFFDGSDAAYRKALHVGESVDKFKVTRIGAEGVDLERDGKSYTMRVGQQFRRPDGGDWNLIGADLVRQEAQAQAGAANGATVDPSAPVAIPSDADEVTKRLMQRRNQQLKQ